MLLVRPLFIFCGGVVDSVCAHWKQILEISSTRAQDYTSRNGGGRLIQENVLCIQWVMVWHIWMTPKSERKKIQYQTSKHMHRNCLTFIKICIALARARLRSVRKELSYWHNSCTRSLKSAFPAIKWEDTKIRRNNQHWLPYFSILHRTPKKLPIILSITRWREEGGSQNSGERMVENHQATLLLSSGGATGTKERVVAK